MSHETEAEASLLRDQGTADPVWANEKNALRKPKGKKLQYFLLAGVIGVVTTLIVAVSLKSGHTKSNKPKVWMQCGSTPEEARARGCHFERMLVSWIPDACYFREPVDDYADYISTRTWYLDPLMKHRAPDGLFETGNYKALYTDAFHKVHCLYAWEKQLLAIEKKLKLVDITTGDLGHAKHCNMALSPVIQAVENHSDYGVLNQTISKSTVAMVEYPECAKAPWL
jgi:hypothetical protein